MYKKVVFNEYLTFD